MTGFQNLHTHTTYCDGNLRPEGMIKAAIKKGCGSLGFSGHAHVPFDLIFSMKHETTRKYMSEVKALKEKYEGTIEIFLGLEQDYYTDRQPEGLDYVLGTVHYLKKGDKFVSVDASESHLKAIVNTYFGGDYYAMAEEYYESMAGIIKRTNADIVGHFDLITKYNNGGRLFDETHPRYKAAALSAMDEILKDCKIFELNTGAIYRFGKTDPYPSAFLLKELLNRGGEVAVTSDSHDGESIGFRFAEMHELLKTCGYKHTKRLTKNGFTDVGL